MSPERLELALRRQRLQLQAMDQRDTFVRELRPFLPAFSAADRVKQGAEWVRSHTQEIAAGCASALAVTVVLKPRRAWRWARRGFSAWRLWQRVQAWQQNFGQAPPP